MGKYATTQLNARQRELVERLERGENAATIAEGMGITRSALYQSLERLVYRGVIERVTVGKYRRTVTREKQGSIRRIILPVNRVESKRSAADFNRAVDTALAKLNAALNSGFQVVTEHPYETSFGDQLLYVLHKSGNDN